MKGVSRSSWLAGWLQREEMRRSKSKGKSDTLFTQLIIAINREQLQTTGELEGKESRWPAIPRVKHSTINRWTCDLLFKLTSKLSLHSIAKPFFDGECVKHSIFSQFNHTNDTVPPDKDNKTSKGKKNKQKRRLHHRDNTALWLTHQSRQWHHEEGRRAEHALYAQGHADLHVLLILIQLRSTEPTGRGSSLQWCNRPNRQLCWCADQNTDV